MKYTQRHKMRRFLVSASPLFFAGVAALASAIIAILRPFTVPAGTPEWFFKGPFLVGLLILAIVLLIIQTWAEYRKRTYEPTLAFKLGEIFESEEMIAARSIAAQFLQTNHVRLSDPGLSCLDLDDVFDFFESVGFYMNGDQISPEAAHHWYHYWVRGYYSAGQEYLRARQYKDKEPTQWKFIKKLLDATNEIERKMNKEHYQDIIKDEKLKKFLSDEIELTKHFSKRKAAAKKTNSKLSREG